MHRSFETPYPVQFSGSGLARRLLALAGWQVRFEGFPTLQGVIVGYPHTSNWDFIVMVMVKWAMGLPIKFWAKDSLFRVPLFGRWLRYLGGVSVDRNGHRGTVSAMAHVIEQHKQDQQYFWMGLAPEGTRKWTAGWRSGFYQLATQADVPLCLLRIDYGQKVVDFTHFMWLSGDVDQDYQHMAQVFDGVRGFHPDQAAPVQPLTPSTDLKESDTDDTRSRRRA